MSLQSSKPNEEPSNGNARIPSDAKSLEVPSSARSISNPSLLYRLVSEIYTRFKNAYKSKIRRNRENVEVNYKSSWGDFAKSRRWEKHDSLKKFLNLTNDKPIICTLNHKWMFVPYSDYCLYRIHHMVREFDLWGAESVPAVIEVGCGWGRNLFSLRAAGYSGVLQGYELTQEGVQAAREIADYFEIADVSFEQANLLEDHVPAKNSIVFTSHCLEQIKYNTRDVIDRIRSWEPSHVIHFEPTPELQRSWLPRDLINRAYNKMVDYQNNLYSTLAEMDSDGVIDLCDVTRTGYYQLPVQETTCLVWKPKV